MDYVQRFMTSHGNLLMAPNSALERQAAWLHFLPLLVFDAAWYLVVRLRERDALQQRGPRPGHFPLPCLSGILNALAFPSFLHTAGVPVLGWFCLVPLMLCLAEVTPGRGIFYGTLAACFRP